MSRLPATTGNGAADAQHSVLLPWMKQWCLWYLSPQPTGKRPRVWEQTREASKFAGYPITREALRQMRKRPDVQLFLQTLEGSVTEAAKEALTLAHRRYVEAHQRGMDMALAAGDYKAIPAFTVPILDRIVPKKADNNVGNKTIIVNVQEGAAKALLGGGPEIGEIVVEPVLDTEEADDDPHV